MSKKIDIISLYLGNYARCIAGREIARLIKLNHQTALNHLNELVKEKVLGYVVKGRNKEYSINLSSPKTKILIEIAESFKAMESLSNKELGVIIKEVIPFAESIILFGSFAAGNYNKNSDIDLVLVGKSNKERIDSIKKRYSREINIEYVSYSDFVKSLKEKNSLAVEILKNHIIYGNVSPIIRIFLKEHTK